MAVKKILTKEAHCSLSHFSTLPPTQAAVPLTKVPVLKVPELRWDAEEPGGKSSGKTTAGGC